MKQLRIIITFFILIFLTGIIVTAINIKTTLKKPVETVTMQPEETKYLLQKVV